MPKARRRSPSFQSRLRGSRLQSSEGRRDPGAVRQRHRAHADGVHRADHGALPAAAGRDVAHGVPLGGAGRARLRVAARYIKNGTVKFPRHGCEQLITQLLGFGGEKHDDLVDALVWLILGVAGDGIEEQKVHYI